MLAFSKVNTPTTKFLPQCTNSELTLLFKLIQPGAQLDVRCIVDESVVTDEVLLMYEICLVMYVWNINTGDTRWY